MDTSILPMPVAGQFQNVVYVVARKGADLVLENLVC